eukprot:5950034-Amphidinium_carterae.1
MQLRSLGQNCNESLKMVATIAQYVLAALMGTHITASTDSNKAGSSLDAMALSRRLFQPRCHRLSTSLPCSSPLYVFAYCWCSCYPESSHHSRSFSELPFWSC